VDLYIYGMYGILGTQLTIRENGMKEIKLTYEEIRSLILLVYLNVNSIDKDLINIRCENDDCYGFDSIEGARELERKLYVMKRKARRRGAAIPRWEKGRIKPNGHGSVTVK